ncbi:MAG: hypothetical protein TEF_10515 [Rhizobiales bacterium NRL2]|jgi:MFS family permease|nr:MAG: hypothetical protein TEF_10515 [Rhizobiales bacterium NRL2]
MTAPSAFRGRLIDGLNKRFFYGWIIVFVGVVGMLVSGAGQSHTFSVFFPLIAADLDLSVTEVAAAFSAATLAGGFLLPLVGRQIDRFGGRPVLLLVILLLGLAATLFSMVGGVATLMMGFAALRLLGQGSTMLGCTNIVSQWFERQRGFAISLIMLGFAASMAIHPPLSEWLVSRVGWREAWIWIGVATWIAMVPLVFFLVESKPEDVGLKPDGGEAEARSGFGPSPVGRADEGLRAREALRTRAFWLIAPGLFSISMLVTALHVFQVSIFLNHGLDPALAARSFPISALTMALAMPLVGRMLDAMRTERVFAMTLVVMCLSLIAASFVRDLPTAIVYAMIFGLNNAMMLSLFGYLWPRYFGRKHLGSIQGMGQTLGLVAASTGALPFGLAYDMFGTYDGILRVSAIMPLCFAVLILLFLRTPPQLRESGAGAAES